MDAIDGPVARGCVAFLVLLGGCTGAGFGGSSPTPPPETSCARSVSFFGLGSPGETVWAPDRIAIGYTVDAGASVFFVAYGNGSAIGTIHVSTTGSERAVTADGDGIQLDRPLTGTPVLRVVAYADTNGNGAFDAGTDMPCRTDGELVEAGPRRIDVTDLQFTPSPSTTAQPTETG